MGTIWDSHNITPASHGTHWESSSGWRTICPLLRSTHWFGCGFQEAVGSHSSIYPFPCHTWVLLGIGLSSNKLVGQLWSEFSKMHGLLAVQSPCDWWCQSHFISLGVGGGWRPWINSNYILYYYHTNGWNLGDHVGGNGNDDFDIPYHISIDGLWTVKYRMFRFVVFLEIILKNVCSKYGYVCIQVSKRWELLFFVRVHVCICVRICRKLLYACEMEDGSKYLFFLWMWSLVWFQPCPI